ncbi:efflux transporter outer membrane subunit [Sphingomonas radiodurans]|uniref:efflux transporter outer membrane subunit n=1 Tax=Sphingomonas radiodurans TaxID=2890321 RepID=UPI001E4AAA59|nr:TolC family protein [Sphingomonas radiodurans]WBH15827.1 TolC family protein [Sphingomonas radiodurans]
MAGASLLAACGTPLRRADIQLPPAFQVQADTLDASALDRWWVLFDDHQLAVMIEQALASAPDARSAIAVLDEARANRRQAMAQYDPQGGLSGSVTYQRSTISGLNTGTGDDSDGTSLVGALTGAGQTTTYSGGFSPSWELGLFGRRSALRSSADADLAVARFTYEASRQSLATNVAGGLFEARGLAVQLEQARETERVTRELADIGRKRVAVGIGAPVDSATLDSDLATAIASRQALEAQLTVSKRTLLVLLGRGTDPVEQLQIEARLGTPPAVPQTTPGELLMRRPDVREAEARVRSAMGNLKLDQLALFPSFTLSPSATQTKITGDNAYSSGLWSIGANFLMPILDRPRLLAEIRAERARGEQAVIAYEKAVQTAYGEAENTITTYTADRARLQQLAVAEERARYAFNAQRTGYRAGITDLTTLLTAERSWRSATTLLSQLQSTTLTDAVNVYRALGGGWTAGDATTTALNASKGSQ